MTTDTSEVGHLVKLNAYFTRVTGGAWSNTLQVTTSQQEHETDTCTVYSKYI